MSTKLGQLVARCKGAVHVTVNNHTSRYQSVGDYIADMVDANQVEPDDGDRDAFARCIEADTIWEVVAYTDTPVGSYQTYGATLDDALDQLPESTIQS